MGESLFRVWRNYPRTSGNPTGTDPSRPFPRRRPSQPAGRRSHKALPGARTPAGSPWWSRWSVLDGQLVLRPPTPGRHGEADFSVEELDHGIQGGEPDRVLLAEPAGPLEQGLLDLLEHRGDGQRQLAQRDGFLQPIEPAHHGRLTFRQVAWPDFDPQRDALQLPFVELEPRALIAPVDLHSDVVEFVEYPGQRLLDLVAFRVTPKDGNDDDLNRRDARR